MAHSLWKAVPFGEAVDVAQGTLCSHSDEEHGH